MTTRTTALRSDRITCVSIVEEKPGTLDHAQREDKS
jgi:hypothetical protein